MVIRTNIKNAVIMTKIPAFSVAVRSQHCMNAVVAGRPVMPSVYRLQQLIEYAWAAGFDEAGCKQLAGKLVDTRKWIGATEIYAVLSFLGVR